VEMLDQLKYFDGNVQMIAGIPEPLKAKYREAFEIDPIAALRLTAVRGKWIDQSQSHNVFMKGTSGRKLSEIYIAAWRAGLKTTYYLRTLAASQIEKSTLDASKFGFTQMRDYKIEEQAVPPDRGIEPSVVPHVAPVVANGAECRIDDPDCEACQ